MGMAIDGDQGGGDKAGNGHSQQAAPNMKERSAAKKRAEKAVGAVLAGGVAESRHIYHTDTATDCSQLVRNVQRGLCTTVEMLQEHLDAPPCSACCCLIAYASTCCLHYLACATAAPSRKF
jgi:hypothetical protein